MPIGTCLIALAAILSPVGTRNHFLQDMRGRSYTLALPGRFTLMGGGTRRGLYAFTNDTADSLELYMASGDSRTYNVESHTVDPAEKPFSRFWSQGFKVDVATWRVDPKELRRHVPWPPQAWGKTPFTRGNAKILSANHHDLVVMISYRGQLSVKQAGVMLDKVSRDFVALNSGKKG